MSLNPFELLQEIPRPYLDPEALKAKFIRLSAPLHPDRVHHRSESEKQEATRRFSELNSAYLRLREPQDRLWLLLEMETGSKPKSIQHVPMEVAELSFEIGKFCREMDLDLRDRSPTGSSPLLKAVASKFQNERTFRLRQIQSKVDAEESRALAELQRLDADWIRNSDRQFLVEALEKTARLFSYIARWKRQLEECRIRLQVG